MQQRIDMTEALREVAAYNNNTVELDEADNTAAVARQLKQAVKKYTTGNLIVRSKGGKTRFIMVMADNIDNKLRKMVLDIAYPKANVRGGDMDNISYGNISDKIISVGVDVWVKALGLKESVEEGKKVTCPKCDGEGCEHCDDKGYHLEEAKAFRDFDVPASPEMKKHIESGKAKILKKVTSVLGPTTKFVVIERPKMSMGSGKQDKVIMATISDPKRGRIKMFAFHGSHVSLAKAMQFAINNKLVVTTKMESVELGEVTAQRRKLGGRQLKNPKTEVMVVDKKGKVIVIDRKDLKSYERKGWVIAESVELGEAWTADSVIKNAEIGSKKGYGINIKKTGGVTKTPYKHMLMTMRRDKSVRVTFDHGKDEFEGTPQSVALYINKKLGIKESVELDEALTLASDDLNAVKKTAQKLARQSPDRTYYVVQNTKIHGDGKMKRYEVVDSVDMHLYRQEKKIIGYGKSVKESVELGESASRETETAKKIAKTGKKLGDWVGKSYFEYEGNLWILGGYGGDAVNRGPIDKAKKTLNKSLLKKLKFNESVELGEATKWKMGDGRPRGGSHIENIRFWDMPKDKLQYIIKDAGKAMKANPKARKATTGPGNWADQVNDAHTVLGWRKKNNIKESVERVREGMSPALMKILGITNPLKGKGYPYQEEEAKKKGRKGY